MTLLTHYEEAISKGEIKDDPLQREILTHMQRLADQLAHDKSSWFSWIHKQTIKGLYIYGSVGVGKTYLVDLFYHHVAEKKKARFHFHHFMQQIDIKLRMNQGQKDPLKKIAKDLAKKIRLLCFDEFLVNDVAYAMILAELLQALAANGVIIVISSNTAPDALYLHGVQRARFLPAIALIKHNCVVLQLKARTDYRLGRTHLIKTYLSPLSEQTQRIMDQQFSLLAQDVEEQGLIKLQNRDVVYLKRDTRAIWFEFDILCNLPRSQLDYLELADLFDTLFLSNIPALTEKHTAQAIMFIYLVDVLYDRGVKMVVSAAVPVEELYQKGEMAEPFKRTLSRLIEMQSIDYLARHPRRSKEEM